MSMCLLQVNQCSFPNCTLNFANQYDLIAHIEYTHIPMIEEDLKRRALGTSNGLTDDKERSGSANLPLSIMSRVYRTAYRPNPIKQEALKVSFNHYRARAVKERIQNQLKMQQQQQQQRVASMQAAAEEEMKKNMETDLEECQTSDPEHRYQCQATDCNKRYKNFHALKLHMKVVHSVLTGRDDSNSVQQQMQHSQSALNPVQQQQQLQQQQIQQQHHLQQIQHQMQQQQQQLQQNQPLNLQQQQPQNHLMQKVGQAQRQDQSHMQYTVTSGALASTSVIPPQNNQSAMQPPPISISNSNNQLPAAPAGPIPANYRPHKCTFCSKRYKTPTGLQNHMSNTHNKGVTTNNPIQDSPNQQALDQLILQARLQNNQKKDQMQQQQQQQSTGNMVMTNQTSPSRQMNLPVSVALNQQQQMHQLHQIPNQKTVQQGPVQSQRTFSVTTTSQPLRFSQAHLPPNISGNTTTGQMLQMQMQQHKRLMQQQQQAAAAAAAQQQQHQQNQSQNQSQQPQQQTITGSGVAPIVTSVTQQPQQQMQHSVQTQQNQSQQQQISMQQQQQPVSQMGPIQGQYTMAPVRQTIQATIMRDNRVGSAGQMQMASSQHQQQQIHSQQQQQQQQNQPAPLLQQNSNQSETVLQHGLSHPNLNVGSPANNSQQMAQQMHQQQQQQQPSNAQHYYQKQ